MTEIFQTMLSIRAGDFIQITTKDFTASNLGGFVVKNNLVSALYSCVDNYISLVTDRGYIKFYLWEVHDLKILSKVENILDDV